MITESRMCPDCSRVLFPSRNGNWPFHFANAAQYEWCPRGGTPASTRQGAIR